MTQAITAIVPVKSLALAKSRLTTLAPAERAALAMAMARTTLEALTAAKQASRIIVVTSDGQIAALARHSGAEVVADPGKGLNAAYAQGLAELRIDEAALLLPADFIRLLGGQIEALIAGWNASTIGLLACKNGDGTNAVLLPAGANFMPDFGPGSFARHAANAGPSWQKLSRGALSFDLDSDHDFAQFGQPPQPGVITYSPKVFLPLTQLCRDVCHYCTFAKSPKGLRAPYMSIPDLLRIASEGAALGCKEALFTLGDRPELRYSAARDWLAEAGYASTLDYLAHAAREVRDQTGLLPHINAGCMSAAELAMLRPVSASMGLMMESTAERLCERGGPHYGSPDKHPAARLATIAAGGELAIPFTTGLLIGIGESRDERIETFETIAELHARYGHIQEVIVQNFQPKPGTRMANHPPAPLEELVWTVEQARAILGPGMSIQCPPNLNPGNLAALIKAGINDWGGVSPLTPDHVNPEAPWPEITALAEVSAAGGKMLAPRLTVYPAYLREAERWIAPEMQRHVRALADGAGLAREDDWVAGRSSRLSPAFLASTAATTSPENSRIVAELRDNGPSALSLAELARLFEARGGDFALVCEAANDLRQQANGDRASYVINRNINYTNICTYKCSFCAFSKGTRKHEGAERPYLLEMEQVAARVSEARQRGASEVCLQGGIHPGFTGETYLEIVRTVKNAVPDMHVHAFSPLEIFHGAQTLGMPLGEYLGLLRDAGLGSLPGTAAEILHDPIRAQICPDKLDTATWLEVIETAHNVGLPTTSTIMFGHVDGYQDWARHLLTLRELQARTGGITELVPLPFVAHEAPMYKRGQARRGPTAREAVLMHAVARLVLHPLVPNVQASWVKLGPDAMELALRSGANDMGGTLMDESITRAAGATHGQEMTVADMADMAQRLGRTLVRRNTIYQVQAENRTPEPA